MITGLITDAPMTALRFSRLLICLVCMWFAGCVEIGGVREEPGAAADAEQLYRQGEFDRAAQAFLQLADARSGDRAHYRLRAAEAYHENGELDAVARTLDDVKARRLGTEDLVRYNLLEAELALNRHDAAHANQYLDFADATLTMSLRLRALELRARAQADSGNALASARTRAELDRWLGGADRQQNETQIVTTLQALGPDALKDRAQTLQPGDPLRPWLDMALRRNGQALPLIVMRPNQAVGTIQQGEREGFRAAHRIALLLPDSGPLKAVAQPVRDGFFTAHFADTNPQRAEVYVYDSGSTAADAVSAYQKAAASGVDRIVGPLSRDAVSAVFAQGHLPVPILALNQPERGETPPPGSAAFGLTPDVEAAQAAEHIRERGITRAIIITATEDWAERAALAFRAQFENRSAQIIGEARVPDNEVNFSTMIRQALTGVTPTSNAAPPPGSIAPPPANDAAIFISMRPQQARLLMPQLKLAGYATVPVFATSHIYSGNNNPGADRDLDGVEFCDAPWLFDAALGLPKRSDIVRSLDTARGAGGRLFALGLDAYALLPYMDWLAQRSDSYLAGATGQLAEDSLGRIQRLLIWARFDNGTPHPVNGGLQMSAAPIQ
jgi:outer membrane PBP1 activator LpoA protein